MPSKLEVHVISSADLQRFAGALFQEAGVAPAMADQWAKSLVWANLRGVDSHGVLRIPGYVERLKSKAINPAPDMRVERRSGAIAVLEADRAPRSEEHTSELQSLRHLVCRLLLENK